ncbi:phosphotyrosine protein phosphatase [Moraxella caviae]|uniref:protein-tyrosine-phosphatase n=2 Tax=Moraxella caviae TaxID=34060 RepID=A0A1S9ZUF4_9GAMM|nr:low molecular weight protein-tyrosine-phosphatase [Moraxella caviae]OOR87023.1 phosphotyrosine protein phosphatase [Moraxella caviae]STZ10024.1 Low molecular weight protein-tyrosine-phosphatase yfkJ [Moraxella caviae]VEW13215.1 Low molecular weight protein-tyrosine-phosphatase yfkJ [Moraxella caviae]
MPHPKSILFVCLGNICRSPSAEAVMRAKCQNLDIVFDSAGTAGYHIGEAPDPRAVKVGARFGYDLSTLRARQVTAADFGKFERIFAMDENNLQNLEKLRQKFIQSQPAHTPVATLSLFDDFTKQSVADPYYGDEQDFIAQFEHISRVAERWLELWRTH